MPRLLLNTIALDPNRWTADKTPHFALCDLLLPIAEAGFRGLEVWQHHVAREDDRAVAALRRQADDLGLDFPVVGLYPTLHHEGEAERQAFDTARRVLDHARRLGASVVKLFVGSKGTAETTEAEYARSLTFVQALCEEARTRHLTLTGETHPDTLFDTLSATRRFLQDVGAENFKVCFQPYDFTDTPRAVADYAALREQVLHVHLQGRKDDGLSLLAAADLDYDILLKALARHHFDGFLCLEFVAGCVVPDPAVFDLAHVLETAQQDRDFVLSLAAKHALALSL